MLFTKWVVKINNKIRNWLNVVFKVEDDDVTGGGSVRPGWGQLTPWNWSGFWCFVEDDEEDEDDEKNNGGTGDEDGEEVEKNAGPEKVLNRDVAGKFDPDPPKGRAVRKNKRVSVVVGVGVGLEGEGGGGVVVVVSILLVGVGLRS